MHLEVNQIDIVEGSFPVGWPLALSLRTNRQDLSPGHGAFGNGGGVRTPIGALPIPFKPGFICLTRTSRSRWGGPC